MNDTMFSCINVKDQVSSFVPGARIPTNRSFETVELERTSPNHHDGSHDSSSYGPRLTDKDMLDKVLEEGLRLKSKCKQLRISLVQQEQLLAEERQNFARKVDDMHVMMETTIAEMRAKHYLEITHIRDQRANEIQELHDRLRAAENDLNYFRTLSNEYEERLKDQEEAFASQHDKPLHDEEADRLYQQGYESGVDAMEIKIAEVEQELQHWKDMYESMANPNPREGSRDHNSNDIRSDTDGPCRKCAAMEVEIKDLFQSIDSLTAAVKSAREERAHFYDESVRLEKQIILLKAEIQSQEMTNLNDTLCRVTGYEKTLVTELKAAKDQIRDLNEALEKLLLSKADVEDAVHRVSRENQLLLLELRSVKTQSRPLSTSSFHDQLGLNPSSGSSRESSFSAPHRAADATKHQPEAVKDASTPALQVITDSEQLTPRETRVVETHQQPSAVPSARRKRLSTSNLSDTLGSSLPSGNLSSEFIHPLSPPAVNQRGATSFSVDRS